MCLFRTHRILVATHPCGAVPGCLQPPLGLRVACAGSPQGLLVSRVAVGSCLGSSGCRRGTRAAVAGSGEASVVAGVPGQAHYCGHDQSMTSPQCLSYTASASVWLALMPGTRARQWYTCVGHQHAAGCVNPSTGPVLPKEAGPTRAQLERGHVDCHHGLAPFVAPWGRGHGRSTADPSGRGECQ
jgi:hypothetical protein